MATISNIEQSRWRKHYCLFIDRLTRFESILYSALTLARLLGCQHISHLEFTSFWYTMPRVSCHSQFRNKGLATIRTHKFISTNILRIFWIFLIMIFIRQLLIWGFWNTWIFFIVLKMNCFSANYHKS